MRRLAACVLACALLPAAAAAGTVSAPLHAAPRAPFAPGAVVVVTAPGAGLATPAGAARAADPALAAVLGRFGLAHARRLQRGAPAFARTIEVTRLASDDPAFDPVAAAAALSAVPGVIAAAPDLRFALHLVPNDPYLSQQWHLSNSAAAIHAPAGWSRETGNANQLIAILDTGVDIEHADLAPQVWVNPYEIPGNGVDDDGDGYVDDVNGWDFGDDVHDPSPEPVYDASSGMDVGWHGTFVAGLAGAASDNGMGIAGVAWGCRLLPLKVTDPDGNIALSSIAAAFDFAITHGATVLNTSFGSSDPSAAAVLQPLVDEAAAAGIVCVASAGNDGTDTPEYPAACDSVVAVASTNASNLRSTWSNWGWYVDCCAPGENVVSTIARNYAYDWLSEYYFELYFGFDGTHAYMSNSGTSFAAPLVSGAVALVRSRFPWASAQQVTWLMGRVGDVKLYDDPIGPKLDLDLLLGHSLAVEPPAAPAGLALAPPAPNPATGRTSLAFTLPAAGAVRLAILDAAGRRVRTLAAGAREAGPQALAWDLRDEAGRAVAPGLYFARLETAAGATARRLVVAR